MLRGSQPPFAHERVAIDAALDVGADLRLLLLRQLRKRRDGDLLAAQVADERLEDLALHPRFADNHLVYFTYIKPVDANRGTPALARGRFENGALLDVKDLVVTDPGPVGSSAVISRLVFGRDGKLYMSAGGNIGNLAQEPGSLRGKMLRLNADGTIPTDNPFYGTASGANRAIWALGLRNPFTFALNPGGVPAMMINDVGQSTWEEGNVGGAGRNYGWPTTEGDFTPSGGNAGFTRPQFAYPHSGGTTTGCAITGGAFYAPPVANFPAQYQGVYFFADYCSGWIKYVDPTMDFLNRNAPTITNFGRGSVIREMVSKHGMLARKGLSCEGERCPAVERVDLSWFRPGFGPDSFFRGR